MPDIDFTNKDQVLTAVTEDGMQLELASGQLRNDDQVVLAAVQQNSMAVQYASRRLQYDSKIILAANLDPSVIVGPRYTSDTTKRHSKPANKGRRRSTADVQRGRNRNLAVTSVISSLSDHALCTKLCRDLRQRFRRDLEVLPDVMHFSFAYRPDQPGVIFILLYTRKTWRLTPRLPDSDQQVHHFRVKFVAVDWDLHPNLETDKKVPLPASRFEGDLHEKVLVALHEAQKTLPHLHSDIVAITIGSLQIDGNPSPCLHLIVLSKGYIPLGQQPLPNKINGLPVKITEGRYEPCPWRVDFGDENASAGTYQQIDPLRPGCSIGIKGTRFQGTMGGFVVDSNNPTQKYILTNHHVAIDVCHPNTAGPITQPGLSDYKRYKTDELTTQINQIENRSLNPSDQDAEELDHLYQERTKIRNSSVVPEECIIGHVQQNRQMRESRKIEGQMIGIDAAMILLNTSRRIALSMGDRFIQNLDSVYYNRKPLSITIPFGTFLTEDDLVYKDGRTTGVTTGRPCIYPASISQQIETPAEAELPGTLMTFSNYRQPSCGCAPGGLHDVPRFWLHNQYLVAHSGDQAFVNVGDSGAVCYVQRAGPDNNLYPWGLLNGCLPYSKYAYAVLSPLDAVLKELSLERENLVLVTDQNKNYLR
jgi:hypothetical protein